MDLDSAAFGALFSESVLARLARGGSFALESPERELVGLCVSYELECEGQKALAVKTVAVAERFRNKGVSMLGLLGDLGSRAGRYDQVWMCFMKDGNFPSLITRDLFEETRRYAHFSWEL